MRVCYLTEVQAREFESRGILPACANVNPGVDHAGAHMHISYKDADRLVGFREGERDGTGDARWVGDRCRMIVGNVKAGWNAVRGSQQLTRWTSRGNPVNKPIRASA